MYILYILCILILPSSQSDRQILTWPVMLTHGCLQQFNIGFIRNSIKTFETNVLFVRVGLPYTEASFFSFNHIPCQSLPSAANNSGQPNKMVH